MGGPIAPPDQGSFAFDCSRIIALQHDYQTKSSIHDAIICCGNPQETAQQRRTRHNSRPGPDSLATEQELSDFLKSVEKRAFKRSVYHVRDEEAALDIVQDSMMKLAEHYGDKPTAELPMLFQRILSNCTLDWFRRQKTRNALFSNMSDFESASDDGDFDLLETYASSD